jgi:hypothetical protein
MQLTAELKSSLKREYDLCSHAVTFYRKTIRDFEKKHKLSTRSFLRKFEAGTLGDEADYFDWYAFTKLLHKWQDTLSALRTTFK